MQQYKMTEMDDGST